jgi:general secretion pathway protein J
MSTRHRGFTLIELLVALFIAAIMFAIGYGALRQGLTSHEALKDEQARLLQLQTAVRLLEQDFVQVTPRPVRQPIGDEPAQAALLGNLPGTQPVVALTREGWANPAGLQRSGLQRVAYYLENNTLRREHWNVLDPVLTSATEKRELLKHVKTFAIRYLDVNRVWQDQWPPATSTQLVGPSMEPTLRMRPVAVEITIDTDDWGKIVRIIEIAG